jgi:hypothetical protein
MMNALNPTAPVEIPGHGVRQCSGWARAVSNRRSANGTFVPVRLSLHVPQRRRTPVPGHLPTVRDDEFLVQTFKFEGTGDTVNIEYMWFEDIGGRRSWASRPVRLPDIEARYALLSPGMAGGAPRATSWLDGQLSSRLPSCGVAS